MTTPVPDHITRPNFAVSVRGYERAQVDAYFGRVVEWLTEADNRAGVAERSRDSLSREVVDLRATITMLEQRAGMPAPESMSAFSERMGQVMQSAMQAAQELRSEAEEEAQGRLESAASEADRIVTAARQEAEEVLSSARRAQRAIEESIADLRVARADAVQTLHDLQQRISAAVGAPEPSLEAEAEAEAEADAETDVTMVVPAVGAQSAAIEQSRDVHGPKEDDADATEAGPSTDTGVIVTADPTIVQQSVEPTDEHPPVRRRRSA